MQPGDFMVSGKKFIGLKELEELKSMRSKQLPK
jgi:hypothetical protein